MSVLKTIKRLVVAVEQNCSQHSRLMNIDSADRAFESLYLEAVKKRRGA